MGFLQERYAGWFSRDVRHGEGVYIFPDGSRFEGSWANDKKHGRGKFIYMDGSEMSGIWEEDVFLMQT